MIKKISYRSSGERAKKPEKNLPTINISDDSATENGGKNGFIMPGDLYPNSSGNPPEKLNYIALKRNILNLKSKKNDKKESMFLSYMMEKISQAEEVSYDKLFMQDMFNFSASSIIDSKKNISELSILFSEKKLSLIREGYDKYSASKISYMFIKSKYPIVKTSQVNVSDHKAVAKNISDIINIMISRFSFKSRLGAKENIRRRVSNLNVQDISNKKTPAGAGIGTSIALVKNILNGKDSYFIKLVIEELQKNI
jgi:hypothetical protein